MDLGPSYATQAAQRSRPFREPQEIQEIPQCVDQLPMGTLHQLRDRIIQCDQMAEAHLKMASSILHRLEVALNACSAAYGLGTAGGLKADARVPSLTDSVEGLTQHQSDMDGILERIAALV